MEAVRILIVEDEELIAMNLEMVVGKLGHSIVGIVDNSRSALECLEDQEADLAIMDIQIRGDYDGIELADLIKSQYPHMVILFVTSREDDLSFKRASRSDPVGFLLKPFSDIQLQRSLELAIQKMEAHDALLERPDLGELKKDGFFIRKGKKIHRVEIGDIYYLEADGRYCRVFTASEMFHVRRSMKELFTMLPNELFVQCHRSFIVNLKQVKSVDLEDGLVILSERKLPFSRREKDNLLQRLEYL